MSTYDNRTLLLVDGKFGYVNEMEKYLHENGIRMTERMSTKGKGRKKVAWFISIKSSIEERLVPLLRNWIDANEDVYKDIPLSIACASVFLDNCYVEQYAFFQLNDFRKEGLIAEPIKHFHVSGPEKCQPFIIDEKKPSGINTFDVDTGLRYRVKMDNVEEGGYEMHIFKEVCIDVFFKMDYTSLIQAKDGSLYLTNGKGDIWALGDNDGDSLVYYPYNDNATLKKALIYGPEITNPRLLGLMGLSNQDLIKANILNMEKDLHSKPPVMERKLKHGQQG